MDMDRAAKLKKYGTKHSHVLGKKNRDASVEIKVAVIVAVMICALGLLFFAFHHKKEESALGYVTKAELASCMSFLLEDTLPKEWQQDADSYVTQGQMKELIRNIGLAGIVSVSGGNEPLKREEVMNYYEQILDYLDLDHSVNEKMILILSSDGKSCQTQLGSLKWECPVQGIADFYTYEVYIQDQKILGIKAQSEKTAALREVQVYSVSDDKVQVTYEQEEYEIACKDKEGLKELKGAAASCTLCIKGGAITKVKNISKENAAKGKEDKEGKEEIKEKSASQPDTVKVVLLNQGAVHYDQIYLACDGKWTIKKNEKKTVHKKTDVVSVKKLKIKKGKFAVAEPAKAEGKLYLTDKKGNPVSKGYYGTITIYKDGQGYYLVNKVNIEKYLYSVVASEMPAAFGSEALKAQAVCARSYVYRQMAAEDYRDYHAQIDDSTNYQVYNKSDVVNADMQAVEATAGEVMYAQDEIVNAYYFSSSFGRTANMEIWGQKEKDYPYLKIKSLNPADTSSDKLDLSDEEDFRKYISKKEADVFDSSSRYYRWQAKAELSACTKELKEKIKIRQEINPNQFTFYSTAKKKVRKVSSLKGFGGAKKMYCSKRGKSGAVLVLTIQFEFGKVEIKSEYNIRSIIGCTMEQITYADGTTDTGSRFLPSAYFSLSYHKKSGRYVLTGGGNGHGMGMSQYGAAGMAQAGWNYKQILTFFYDGVKVQTINKK